VYSAARLEFEKDSFIAFLSISPSQRFMDPTPLAADPGTSLFPVIIMISDASLMQFLQMITTILMTGLENVYGSKQGMLSLYCAHCRCCCATQRVALRRPNRRHYRLRLRPPHRIS